jgi:hypothetical protein
MAITHWRSRSLRFTDRRQLGPEALLFSPNQLSGKRPQFSLAEAVFAALALSKPGSRGLVLPSQIQVIKILGWS